MTRKQFSTGPWTRAIKNCADSGRVKQWLEVLADSPAAAELAAVSEEQARILSALFSGSKVLSERISRAPALLSILTPENLQTPSRKERLEQEVETWLSDALSMNDFAGALRRIREFKERETLRIAARDLARMSNVPEITREISDLADVCLDCVWQVCFHQMTCRYGTPFYSDPEGHWRPAQGCVFGMGKLGGQELNYSSDVDVIFAYSEEGFVFKEPPRGPRQAGGGMTNHQFFNRVAECFIAEVGRTTSEGTLYRIDLRLRPEGDSGPLSRSLPSYENYYAQWGQTWERMMLIKARRVAGDQIVAGEFLEMVQPFRYPRSINPAVLREIAAMKDRIEAEVVKAGELDRNVKLGRGGIREIEFIVQSLQLLHAGRQPFLQNPQTLPGLQKLAAYEHLSAGDVAELYEAYCFLRDVEHRLQMEDNLQTHTIPLERAARERLARLMGFPGFAKFEAVRAYHTANVRRVFDRLFKAEDEESRAESRFPSQFAGEEDQWKRLLAEHQFKDIDRAFRVLREFVEGPGYVHVSARTSALAHALLPRLFALCPGPDRAAAGAKAAGPAPHPPLSDPDRVVTRLDSFIAAYGARSTLFELWHSNPSIFELLVLLFDRSEFLAELAIRTPDLVDELVTSGRLRQRKAAEETLRDLRHGLDDADQHLWLRRYHQAELMRIGLRDILGLADPEQYLTELSALADACLGYAVEVITRKHKLKEPPFAVIGLGKLGGVEIDYGSDLDIVFVACPGAKNLPRLSKLAVEFMDLVSRRTEQGLVFQTDPRLRPDGEKGLLVNTLKAYEEYYRQRALLWEIQSLSRARFIAGAPAVGAQFEKLAARLGNFQKPDLPLAAYQPGWRQTMHQMRMRIEKERTPKGKDHLAIKTGVGGLMDAEFVAQALCLAHGWHEPNTLKALEHAQIAGVLAEPEALIENFRRLRRVEGILRRWSYEGETVLPDTPEPFYRVSVRCGCSSPEEFSTALAGYRKAIRAGYNRVFAPGGTD